MRLFAQVNIILIVLSRGILKNCNLKICWQQKSKCLSNVRTKETVPCFAELGLQYKKRTGWFYDYCILM